MAKETFENKQMKFSAESAFYVHLHDNSLKKNKFLVDS